MRVAASLPPKEKSPGAPAKKGKSTRERCRRGRGVYAAGGGGGHLPEREEGGRE